ncbi:hypothetical protein [Nonomuraea sp. NPDC003754]
MITLTATVLMFRRLGSEKPAYALPATAGVLDSMANRCSCSPPEAATW